MLKSKTRFTLASLLLAISTLVISQQSSAADKATTKLGPLDLIPADACGAIAIRNFKQLKQRGERLIRETDEADSWFSTAFDEMYKYLGITQGVNEDAAGAVILTTFDNPNASFVIIVPVSDLDQMAANFKLKATDLKPDTIVERTDGKGNKDAWGVGKLLMVHGKHLYIARNKESLKLAVGKPLRTALSKKQVEVFEKSDVLAHISSKGWGAGWKDAVASIKRFIARNDKSPEARVAKQLGDAIADLRSASIGLNLDGGIGLNALMLFNETDRAQKVLTRLSAGDKTSDLRGLPSGKLASGNLVAAYGVKGDGEQNVDLFRALVQMGFIGLSPTRQVVSALNRPALLGVFGEVWRRLKGHRTGAYLNADPSKHGALSVVSILDSESPGQFLLEMTKLAIFINNAGMKLEDGRVGAINKATVEKLIVDLGDVDFRVRSTAMTKLNLIGEPILPFLETVIDSKDAEVRLRARQLQSHIKSAIAARQKAVFKEDLLSKLKPKFVYFHKVETRHKQAVSIINVKLSDSDKQYTPVLRELFGPDWNKIRLAIMPKKVVMFLGSNTELFDEAIRNQLDKSIGLSNLPAVKVFGTRSEPDRQFEMHISMARMAQLMSAMKRTKGIDLDASGLTSTALTIRGTDQPRIQLDFFTPYSEVKVMSKIGQP